MDAFRRKARSIAALAVVALSLWSAGCATGRRAPRVSPGTSEPSAQAPAPAGQAAAAGEVLARMGYTVQVGAFAVLDNARELAAALAAAGLDAFYFPSGTGLFKVRFGNFASRETAQAEARAQKAAGRIGEYFIVGPADYAATRPQPPGPAAAEPGLAAAGLRDRLVATAESFVGVDYAWGGTSTRSGFDCSGLVLAVYQLNGLAMPRSVRDQFRAGTPVARDRLKKGDLVFFSAAPHGDLTHVGIYIGEGAFIHAPGSGKQVRRESLESAYFRTRFAGARLYLR